MTNGVLYAFLLNTCRRVCTGIGPTLMAFLQCHDVLPYQGFFKPEAITTVFDQLKSKVSRKLIRKQGRLFFHHMPVQREMLPLGTATKRAKHCGTEGRPVMYALLSHGPFYSISVHTLLYLCTVQTTCILSFYFQMQMQV